MDLDVLVIGGGASGLFCAAQLARAGLGTLVLEKRQRPARKLLITGKGRCNLTNNCGGEAFLQGVVRGGRFLHSAASAFPPAETMRFFEGLGVPLKTERGNRVFPVSDRAGDIVQALLGAVEGAGGRVLCETVRSLHPSEGGGWEARCASGRTYRGQWVVIATGGLSYPRTGSTGDGYRFARALGHTVVPTAPSLVPLNTREDVRDLCGLTLKNCSLALYDGPLPGQPGVKAKKPVFKELGELLFTHTGLSGPLVLTASSLLDPARPADYSAVIDLKPGLDAAQLDRRILRDFEEAKNRDFINALHNLLPRSLVPAVVARSGIPPGQKVNLVTRGQRAALVGVVKGLTYHISSLGGMEEAVITRGGVKTSEVDPKTMASRLAQGVYFVGEVLDLDARTGGFNLQIAFSTAYLAAAAIARRPGTA